LKTWNQGSFEGDYATFFENIKKKMWWKNLWHGKKQVPVLINEHPSNDMFDIPFKI
jgi:hypothetical protein